MNRSFRTGAALAAIAVVAAPAAALAQDWRPGRTLEWMVPSGPGAALDMAARHLRDAIDRSRAAGVPFVVHNRPGGANMIALNALLQAPGNPHLVATFTHGQINNRLLGAIPVGPIDFTPLAILFDETLVVAVRADSPIRNGRDLVERLRKDPGAASIAVATAAGNHIHVAIALPLRAGGVDISKLTIVPYKSSAESIAALLGGHIDVVSASAPNVIAQMEAGKIRVIAVASEARQPGPLAAVPTWREQGYHAVYHSSQGVLGPRDLTPAQVRWWEAALREATQTEEWKRLLERNYWRPNFLGAAEARRFLEAETAEARQVLIEIGLLRP